MTQRSSYLYNLLTDKYRDVISLVNHAVTLILDNHMLELLAYILLTI